MWYVKVTHACISGALKIYESISCHFPSWHCPSGGPWKSQEKGPKRWSLTLSVCGLKSGSSHAFALLIWKQGIDELRNSSVLPFSWLIDQTEKIFGAGNFPWIFLFQKTDIEKRSVFFLRQCRSTLKGLSSSVIVTELSLEYFPLRLSRLLHNKTSFYPKKHWICLFDGPSPFLHELFFRRIHETELVWVPYGSKSTCGNLSNNYVEQICLQTHSLSGCQTPKDMSETSFCVLGIDFGECLLKI